MRGVKERVNNNGFYVLEIHYSADPDKDPETPQGQAWIQQAKKGMPESAWRKEYEIDWFALSGELIYPMFSERIHCCEPFKIPPEWTRYMAIDPGVRNPTAILWGAVNPEGEIFFYREHYKPEWTVEQHAKEIKRLEGDEKIFRRLIDPSAWNRNPIDKRTIAGEYNLHKIYCQPAVNDVESGIERVTQWLLPDERTGNPSLYVFNTLMNFLDEIRQYRWEELTGKQAEKRDPKEAPMKLRDHLMDCLRYIIIDSPRYFKLVERKPIPYKELA